MMPLVSNSKYKLQDLINIEQFRFLQERLNQVCIFPSSIIDNEGNILTAISWRDVCTKFHRANKECEQECIKSDQYILEHLEEADPAVIYRCPHGLVDSALPIIIDGVHFGNFFTGQFFLESPDMAFFKQQAGRFGFDEAGYLEAVARVPVWSQKQLDNYLLYIKGLIDVIATNGLKNLREIEARRKLEEAEDARRASEERFRLLYENVPLPYQSLSVDGKFLDINPAWLGMLGYQKEEVVGQHFSKFVHPELIPDFEQNFPHFKERGSIQGVEFKLKRKDGRYLDVSFEGRAGYDADGRFQQTYCVFQDITARKQAEKHIKDLKEFYETILNNVKDGILVTDPTDRVIYINPGMEAIARADAEQVLGLSVIDDLPVETNAHFLSHYREAKVSGVSQQFEVELTTPADRYSVLSGWIIPRFHDGEYIGIICTIQDVTERRQAEEALRRSEERAQAMLNALPDLMFRLDDQGVILGYKAEAADLHAQKETSLIGKRNRDMTPPEFADLIEAQIKKTLGSGELQTFEYRLSIPGNGLRDFEARMVPSGAREVTAIVRDITERVQAEEALKLTQFAIDKAKNNVFLLNTVGQFTYINEAASLSLGYQIDELIGRYVWEIDPLVSPENWPQLWQEIKKKSMLIIEMRHRRKDGSEFPVEIQANYLEQGSNEFIFAFVTDITERKNAEMALRESEAKFRLMAENTADVIWVLDVDAMKFRYVSPSIEKLRGYTPEEVLVQPVSAALTPESARKVADLLAVRAPQFMAGEMTTPSSVDQVDQLCRDGSVIQTEITTTFLWNAEGKVDILGVTRDITERKKYERLIEDQVERLQALRDIDKIIGSSFDLRFTLKVLLDKVTALLHIDAASILLYNRHTQTLDYSASSGFYTRGMSNFRQKIGSGNASRTLLERKTIHIRDLREQEMETSHALAFAGEHFRGYVGVPLLAKGEAVGVLEVYHRAALDREPEWFEFLESLAGQAAIAIDNAQLFENLQRSNLELAVAYDATIEGWSRAMDLRDKETEGHTLRVTELTWDLAGHLGIPEADRGHMRHGALLHDIGKIGVPDAILNKPGKLTPEEWAVMQQHPVYAYEMLKGIAYLKPAIDIPYCHHEKWDGSGYPRGLAGEHIPLAARIFAIIDVWDALRSDRPYRPAWPEEKALAYLCEQAGRHFDPVLVKEFLKKVPGHEGTT